LAAAVLGVLLVATLGGAVWFVFNRDSGPGKGQDPGKVGHGVNFDLVVSRLGVRTVAEKLSRGQVESATEDVRVAVQDLYLGGFVDPDRWHDGEFPDAFDVFEPTTEKNARKDLNALTLGAAAGRLEWVEPTKGRTSIVFLLDDQNRPVQAVAGVVFGAVGHLKDGGTVKISNGADLILRPVDGAWQVYSYEASTTIEPQSPTPGASSTSTGTG
jgi:hypothetical protein